NRSILYPLPGKRPLEDGADLVPDRPVSLEPLKSGVKLRVLAGFHVLAGHLDGDIRLQAAFREGDAFRGQPAGDGHLEGRLVGQVDQFLDRALAEGSVADSGGRSVFGQRSGQDLRSRSRTAVDEDHEVISVQIEHALALGAVYLLFLVFAEAFAHHYLAWRQ